MLQPKTFHTFARVTKIVLMVLLIGFELVLNLPGSDAAYINQAALQLTRSQILVNAVYTLVYRPVAEQAQAQSDMQVVVPLFQQEQAVLAESANRGVRQQVGAARAEYETMSIAAQTLANNTGKTVEPGQVNTMVLHAPVCVAQMDKIAQAVQRQVEQQATLIFSAEVAIEGAFIIFFAALLLFARDPFVPQDQRRARGYEL